MRARTARKNKENEETGCFRHFKGVNSPCCPINPPILRRAYTANR